jgi:hypothetical protein
MDDDRAKRRQIFASLAPLFGRILPAAFFRNPGLPGIDYVHPLIKGIYKPVWSKYVLSIASMVKSPYHDETHHNTDGTWSMNYSPEAGNLDVGANAALVRCMTDSERILVLRQITNKTSPLGARHKLLGFGQVELFDPAQQLFRIRGVPAYEFIEFLNLPLEDSLVETAMRLESLEAWKPFLQEDRVIYRVSAQRRDIAFRDVVLDNYDKTCSVTGQKFVYSTTVEADAAHIIGKGVRGTDDPRNGLALSKSIHWAFDRGAFTISDQYEVIIHPKAKIADSRAFPLIAADGKRINLPLDSAYYPHPEALAWHRENRFGWFAKTQ